MIFLSSSRLGSEEPSGLTPLAADLKADPLEPGTPSAGAVGRGPAKLTETP